MLQLLQDFWQFLTNNKDPIDSLLKILTFLVIPIGVLFTAIGWLIRRWWRGRLRVDIKAFDVITDPAILLPRLYGEENNLDVLAHHCIPYQRRDPEHDIQAELRAALNETRYLLITARTGIGKTREAATLATSLMNEGWRIVRVRTGWLDVPKEFPSELGNDRRRILILLDDLNGLFRTGGFMQSPKAEQMPTLRQPAYHDRLLGFLDAFEKMCSENEFLVVATARDEADEWKVLDYDSRDALWKRFKRVELAEPHKDAVVELLEESVARANILAEQNDFLAIAAENDGTFANVVLNLQRAKKEKEPLRLATYTPTLEGSWREVYERVVRQHPAVYYIYDAIELLNQAHVPLYPDWIKSIAFMLWGGNIFQSLVREFRIIRTFRFLTNEEKILAQKGRLIEPRDGQIEAKRTQAVWKSGMSFLHFIFFPSIIFDHFMVFGISYYNNQKFDEAASLFINMTRIYPSVPRLKILLGNSLYELGKLSEAEKEYRKVIQQLKIGSIISFWTRAKNRRELAVAYGGLARVLRRMNHNAELREVYEKTRILMSNEDWYNLACLESVCGNTHIALRHLQRASHQETFDRAWAWKDPDLEWIRDDLRFREIVGPPP